MLYINIAVGQASSACRLKFISICSVSNHIGASTSTSTVTEPHGRASAASTSIKHQHFRTSLWRPTAALGRSQRGLCYCSMEILIRSCMHACCLLALSNYCPQRLFIQLLQLKRMPFQCLCVYWAALTDKTTTQLNLQMYNVSAELTSLVMYSSACCKSVSLNGSEGTVNTRTVVFIKVSISISQAPPQSKPNTLNPLEAK